MIDWRDCPIVQVRPGYVSGQPALRDDPRVPATTVLENLEGTPDSELQAAAAELRENFDLRTPLQDVLAVYTYAKAHVVEANP